MFLEFRAQIEKDRFAVYPNSEPTKVAGSGRFVKAQLWSWRWEYFALNRFVVWQFLSRRRWRQWCEWHGENIGWATKASRQRREKTATLHRFLFLHLRAGWGECYRLDTANYSIARAFVYRALPSARERERPLPGVL